MRPIYTGKRLLKLGLPRVTQLALRNMVNRAKGNILSLGSAVECPICERTFLSFLSFGGRLNEWCPICRSLARHRLMYLYLRNETQLLTGKRPLRILHVGPEFCLKPLLVSIPNATYVSADMMVSIIDLLEVKPDVCMSVAEACFSSDAFDLVICSHVLEHVTADRKAIAELFRVTKPGGLAIIPVPIDWNSEATEEEQGLSPSERAERYGETDHVRKYGRDYLQRLGDAGYEPYVFRLNESPMAKRYRIEMDDPLVVGLKAVETRAP